MVGESLGQHRNDFTGADALCLAVQRDAIQHPAPALPHDARENPLHSAGEANRYCPVGSYQLSDFQSFHFV